jgi:hypothetical protein
MPPIMEKLVIPIVVALSVSGITGLITYLQVFFLVPDFKVTLVTTTGSTIQHEQLTITNVGRAQAKNANIVVESNDTLSSVGARCFEGNFTAVSAANTFELEFDRISTNVRCQISFDSSIDRGIQGVIIIADDMAGYEYYPPSQGQERQANAIAIPNAEGTRSSSTEVTFTTQEKELQVVYSAIIISFVVSLVVVLPVFYIYRHRKQQKIREQETEREREMRRELTRLRELLVLYSRNIKSATDSSISNDLAAESFSQLQNQVNSLETELEESQSKRAAPDLNENIGQFFSQWSLFEQQILTLAEKSNLDVSKRSNMYKIAKELQSLEILSADFVDKLSMLRVFRNRLAHPYGKTGEITKEQITAHIKELNTLSDILADLIAKR